jgi:hypothetical protein
VGRKRSRLKKKKEERKEKRGRIDWFDNEKVEYSFLLLCRFSNYG